MIQLPSLSCILSRAGQFSTKVLLARSASSSKYSTAVVSSCRLCQGQRNDRHHLIKTHARNLSFYNHRTISKPHDITTNISAFDRHLTNPPLYCGNQNILLQRQFIPTLTVARSIGISISDDGVKDVYVPTPTEKCYDLLEYIHDAAGLPWWLTILATTILLRGVIVFPFAVWQQRVFAKIENVQPMINAYVEQIKQQLALVAKDEGWSQRQMAKAFSNDVRLLVSNVHFRNKCNPYKLSYLVIWQTGVWVSMTMALGQMTGKHPELFSTELDVDVLPQLATQGILWFSDLTQTDLALPIMLGLINVTLVELWSLRRGPLTRTQHYLHNVFRIVAIASTPAAAMMPAAVSFYWFISSLIGLGQFALLRTPSIRRWVGIPHAPSEMKRPLEEMRTALKARYSKKVF